MNFPRRTPARDGGFVGDALVLIPRPVPPRLVPACRAAAPAHGSAAAARMMQAKQDFARLMLGMFAGSTPAFPVTYSYVGQAEAPQGKADVIDVKGPANFTARLFIADNGLPIMVSGNRRPGPADLRVVRCMARPGGPPPGAPASPPPVSHRSPARPAQQLHPRDPPGLRRERSPPQSSASSSPIIATSTAWKLPFRIRRAAGTETTEETTFDRYRINAKVDPRRFDTTAK
jgi:hypothetical protein